ncbi:hypothetical protein D3C76_1791130 [compost metagenome]
MDEDTLRSLISAMDGGPAIPSKGTGVGLLNVHRRLKLYFNEAQDRGYGLVVSSKIGEGTCVSFEIPSEGGGGGAL